MLLTLALALALPTTCFNVKHVCRACPPGAPAARCSNNGIACQPSIRICRPRLDAAGKMRRSVARP